MHIYIEVALVAHKFNLVLYRSHYYKLIHNQIELILWSNDYIFLSCLDLTTMSILVIYIYNVHFSHGHSPGFVRAYKIFCLRIFLQSCYTSLPHRWFLSYSVTRIHSTEFYAFKTLTSYIHRGTIDYSKVYSHTIWVSLCTDHRNNGVLSPY